MMWTFCLIFAMKVVFMVTYSEMLFYSLESYHAARQEQIEKEASIFLIEKKVKEVNEKLITACAWEACFSISVSTNASSDFEWFPIHIQAQDYIVTLTSELQDSQTFLSENHRKLTRIEKQLVGCVHIHPSWHGLFYRWSESILIPFTCENHFQMTLVKEGKRLTQIQTQNIEGHKQITATIFEIMDERVTLQDELAFQVSVMYYCHFPTITAHSFLSWAIEISNVFLFVLL